MVYYGLLLYFVLEYIRPGSYVPALNALHLNSIVPVAVFLGAWLKKGENTVSRVLNSMNARWILYLVFLMIISGLTCDVKTYALMKFEAVIGYFFIFLVIKKEVYEIGRAHV